MKYVKNFKVQEKLKDIEEDFKWLTKSR
jgi:hypothetical protein